MKIKNLIFEEEVVSPEAQPNASYAKFQGENPLYGKYLFAPKRKDVPKEPNTPEEEELYHAFGKFIQANDAERLESKIPQIMTVMANHDYQPIMDPGHITVYRGISYLRKTLEELKQGSQFTLHTDSEGNKYYHVIKSGILNPFTGRGSRLQSWSAKPKAAAKFAYDARKSLVRCPTVFVANTEDGMFFGNPKTLTKTVYPAHSSEYETISIGPVPFTELVYYEQNPDNKTKDNPEFVLKIESILGGNK